MLLTSWIRSFRQSWLLKRHAARQARRRQKEINHLQRQVEKLENRSLLTTLVIDSDFQGAVGNALEIRNADLDLDSDGELNQEDEFDSFVIDASMIENSGGRGVDIELSDLTLKSLVFDDIIVDGNVGDAVHIKLTNVTIENIAFVGGSITGENGPPLILEAIDTVIGSLSLFDVTVQGPNKQAVQFTFDSISKNSSVGSLNISGSDGMDGVLVKATGKRGVVRGATNDFQSIILSFDHGLETGTQVRIEGSETNEAINVLDTITVIDKDRFRLDNTDATTSGLFSGEAEFFVPVTINNGRVTGNVITGNNGDDGFTLELTNSNAPNFVFEGNQTKGANFILTNSPLDGLVVENNVIDTSQGGLQLQLDESPITSFLIKKNTIMGSGSTGTGGIIINAIDSGIIDARILENTIQQTSGHGISITPIATDEFVEANGPLVIDFRASGGGIRDNTIESHRLSGFFFDFPENTQIVADFTGNVVESNQGMGFDFTSKDVFDLVVGGEDREEDGNLFNANSGDNFSITMVDFSRGEFIIENNTFTRGSDGIAINLISRDNDVEATNRLRPVIKDNYIGVDAATALAGDINDTTTQLLVANSDGFPVAPYTVLIDGEQILVNSTGFTQNDFNITRGVNGTIARPHKAGATVVLLTGGNRSRGIAWDTDELSVIEDALTFRNVIANNLDDGIKFDREDDASVVTTNPREGQTHPFTIRENTISNNASNPELEIVFPGTPPVHVGGGIEIFARNDRTTGTLEFLVVENSIQANVLGNTLVNNQDLGTNGLVIRAAADARIDMTLRQNVIAFNSQNGVLTNTRQQALAGIDERDISGLWTKNDISDNGLNGIRLASEFARLRPLVVGLLANDPVDGLSLGNTIFRNGTNGIQVAGPTATSSTFSITNNKIGFNGVAMIGPGFGDPMAMAPTIIQGTGVVINDTVDVAIKSNTFRANRGMAIDINASNTAAAIRDNFIVDGLNDGVEISAPGDYTFLGNIINRQVGKGIDIRVSPAPGTTLGESNIKIGDGTEEGRNFLIGNARQGLYVLTTADQNQGQNEDAQVRPTRAGILSAIVNLVLKVDTNTITDNGLESDYTANGFVLRVGTNNAGLEAYDIAPGAAEGPGTVSNEAGVIANGRVNAKVVNNIFGGNFGEDFKADAHISTVDPPRTGSAPGSRWNTSVFSFAPFARDPLARLNLQFANNKGDSIDVNPEPFALNPGPFTIDGYDGNNGTFVPNFVTAGQVTASYDNQERVWKSRHIGTPGSGGCPTGVPGRMIVNEDGGLPPGPWPPCGVRYRDATRVASRTNLLPSPEDLAPTPGPTGPFRFPEINFAQGIDPLTGEFGPFQQFHSPTPVVTGGPFTGVVGPYEFGTGIVANIDNFGTANPPFHMRADTSGNTSPTEVFTVRNVTSGVGSQNIALFTTGQVQNVDFACEGCYPGDYESPPTQVIFSQANFLPTEFDGFGPYDPIPFMDLTATGMAVFRPGERDYVGGGSGDIAAIHMTSEGWGYVSQNEKITTVEFIGGILMPNEDLNMNGILDPGEDVNMNGQLELGLPAIGVPIVNNGFVPGDFLEITGIQPVDRLKGIHGANGIFEIEEVLDGFNFTLKGTRGANSPDRVPDINVNGFTIPGDSGIVVHNGFNELNLLCIPCNLEQKSWLYDGTGPSTFRIVQEYDTSGLSQNDEFKSGDNFYDRFGGFVPEWHGWTPNTNPLTGSFPDPNIPSIPIAFVSPPVTPEIRTDDAGIVTIRVTEDVDHVEIEDFILKRDGVVVDISTLPVEQISPSVYQIDLSTVTAAEGNYELRLDNTNPTARFVPINPDPRKNAVGAISVKFREPVTGVDISDFILAQDIGDGNGFVTFDIGPDGENLALTRISPSVYSIDVSALTKRDATYSIALPAARTVVINNITDPLNQPRVVTAVDHGLASGQEITIRDNVLGTIGNGEFTVTVINVNSFTLNGSVGSGGPSVLAGEFDYDPEIIDEILRPLAGNVIDVWVRNPTRPEAEIVAISPDPRDTAVDSIEVVFDEPVRTFNVNVDDFLLTRDIGLNPIPIDLIGAGATVTPLDPRLEQLTSVVTGNVVQASGTSPIVLNLAEPSSLTTGDRAFFAGITYPNGFVGANGTHTVTVINDRLITLDGTVGPGIPSVPNTGSYKIFSSRVATRFSVNGLSAVTQPDGLYRFTITVNGTSPIDDVVGDTLLFANLTEWTVITPGPSVDLDKVLPDPRTTAVSTPIRLRFDEPITNAGLVAETDFNLTIDRGDGKPVLVNMFGVPVTQIDNQTLEIDISSVTTEDGDYVLSVDPTRSSIYSQTDLLLANIDATETTVIVNDVSGFPPNPPQTQPDRPFNIQIGDEQMTVTSVAGNVFTVIRGIKGTTAASHTASDIVGMPLAVTVFDEFTIDSTNPTVRFQPVAPDPTSDDAGKIVVFFSEAVTGIHPSNPEIDFDLTLDIGDGNGPQVVDMSSARLVHIGLDRVEFNLKELTTVDGNYVLTFVADGTVTDLVGNPLFPEPTLGTDIAAIDKWELLPRGPVTQIFDSVFPGNPLLLDAVDTWVTDTTVPTVSIDPVTPNLRNSAVGILTATFSEPVEEVDLVDFELSRDDGTGFSNVNLARASFVEVSSTVYTLDLNLVTGSSGEYQLFFAGDGSLVKDRAGNFVDPQSVLVASWETNSTAPSGSFDAISPTGVPLITNAGTATLRFTRLVRTADVDINDFILTRDVGAGPVDVPLVDIAMQPLTVTPVNPTGSFADTFTIDLSSPGLTDAEGNYVLRLRSAMSGIIDEFQSVLAVDAIEQFEIDSTAPTGDIINVFPDPRQTDADLVNVIFNEPMDGSTIDASVFRLTRDDAPVDISGIPFSQESRRRFVLDLSQPGITDLPGNYVLQLLSGSVTDAAGNVIQDGDLGGTMIAGVAAQDSWFNGTDTVRPMVDILDITPDPRIVPVGEVTVKFTEDVTGVDIRDFVLAHNDGTSATMGAITGASNSSNVILTSVNHGLSKGASITVSGVAGNTAANGVFTVGNVTTNTIELLGSAGNGNFTGGGIFVRNLPLSQFAQVTPTNLINGFDDVYTIGFGGAVGANNITASDGIYTLSVVTNDPVSPILDRSGLSLADDAALMLTNVAGEDTWAKETRVPIAIIQNVAPDPRLRPVGELFFNFVDRFGIPAGVKGVDISDFQLFRDSGDGPLPVALTDASITKRFDHEYTIDLSKVTGTDGDYTLNLIADGSIQTINSPVTVFRQATSETWTVVTAITVDPANNMNHSFTDTIDADPGDGVVATSQGRVTLRAAINEANALLGPDIIMLGAGQYSLGINGVGEDLGFAGDFDIRGGELTIIGVPGDKVGDPPKTIISGNDIDRIFHVSSNTTLNLENVIIAGGRVTGSADGGGLRNIGTVNLTNVVVGPVLGEDIDGMPIIIVQGNRSEDGGGGINNAGVMTITRSTIFGNTASGNTGGGGIRNSGDLTIMASLIGGTNDGNLDLRNVATRDGGGIRNISTGTVTLINSTVSGNRAINGDGGGIFNSTIATTSLTNVTIAQNQAGDTAGGIFNSGTTTIENTVIAQNTALTDPDVSGTYDSSGFNLVGDVGSAMGFVGSDSTGVAGAEIDPMLTPLADNGGPTLTHGVRLGSPVIDQGNPNAFVRGDDQRGATRTLDGDGDGDRFVDKGAVEFGVFFVNVTSDDVDPNPGDGMADTDPFQDGLQISLRAAIMEANALPGESTIILPKGVFNLDQTVVDNEGPLATITDITPNPAPTGTVIDSATITFSERVTGIEGVDASTIFTLTRDINDGNGPQNVSLLGIEVICTQTTAQTICSIALDTVTADSEGLGIDGEYMLTLATTATIQDRVLNPLQDDPDLMMLGIAAKANFTIGADFTAPTVDIVDITPDPRSNVVDLVEINFSEDVRGLGGLASTNFTLTFDDSVLPPVNISLASVPVIQRTAAQYTLDLSLLTDREGIYVLSLNAGAISDFAGNPLVAPPMAPAATDTWVKVFDAESPTVDIIDIEPDSRLTAVGEVRIEFSEPVTGVDIADFRLTLDTGLGPNNVDISGLTVTDIDPSTYTIDLSSVTLSDGTYVLSVITTDPDTTIIDISENENELLDDSMLSVGEAARDTWLKGNNNAVIGDLDINEIGNPTFGSLRIIGAGSDLTIIDAQGIDRVFHVAEMNTLTLTGVNVTGGKVTGVDQGGGVKNEGILAGDSINVSGNAADSEGGGIYTRGVLIINDSVIGESGNGNFAGIANANGATGFGGGIFNDKEGNVTINSTSIAFNQAVVDGAGFYLNRNSRASFQDTTVKTNIAGRHGGGGFINDEGDIRIFESFFDGNSATGDGGGLYNEESARTTVINSTFSENAAFNGGGVHNQGEFLADGSTFTINHASTGGANFNAAGGVFLLTDSRLQGNTASADGAGIANRGDFTATRSIISGNAAGEDGGGVQNFGMLTIDRTTLDLNTADIGGGIFNDDGNLIVLASTVSNNVAIDGGGVFNTGDVASVTIDQSTFSGNTAAGAGGAVNQNSVGPFDITKSTLHSNRATLTGGAVFNQGTMTIDNSTISGNTVGVGTSLFVARGGGIANLGNLSTNSTAITDNEALGENSVGGGIANLDLFSPLQIRNTIVSGNRTDTPANGPDANGLGIVTQGYNLIGDNTTVAATFPVGNLNVPDAPNVNQDLVGTGAQPLDAQLLALADNGGQTLTHAFQPGSPAKDAGVRVLGSIIDQRGFTREVDGDGNGIATPDIGPFEDGFIVTNFEDSIDVFPSDKVSADELGLSSLRSAIIEANSLIGNNTIVLGPGTFVLSITGVNEDAAFEGDLDITDNLTIIGAGENRTIIDASGIDRVFHVLGGVTLDITGVTILGGKAQHGGGILNAGGKLILDETTVQGNLADFGAGIFNRTIFGALNGMIDSTETMLVVADGSIFPSAPPNSSPPFVLKIDDEEIRVTLVQDETYTIERGVNGTAPAAHADGAIVSLVGMIELNDATVGGSQENLAELQGGGIFNDRGTLLAISGSTIAGNVSNVYGAGLYNLGTATIDSTTFVDNKADARGGAIYNEGVQGDNTIKITMTGSTIANNSAALGGGVYNNAELEIDNSTLSGNTANSRGGAILNATGDEATGPMPGPTPPTPALTIVLDFEQTTFVDFAGTPVGPFDPTDYGHVAGDLMAIQQSVRDKIDEYFHSIPDNSVDSRISIPAGQELEIDFVFGAFGTPPSNGATEYYVMTIGTSLNGRNGGIANGIGGVRMADGSQGGLPIGSRVASLYANSLPPLLPSALTSGNLISTTRAISYVTSHEIGHTVSLLHVFFAGAVTPSPLSNNPIMSTPALDGGLAIALLNDPLVEFTISATGVGGIPSRNIDQLVTALGTRDVPVVIPGGGTATSGIGNVFLTNSTVVFNATDSRAGGIVNEEGASVSVQNTIIASNAALKSNNDVIGEFVSTGTNLIGDVGDAIGFGLESDQVGTTASPFTPLVGPLEDNGGATQTHQLLIGSPAIDTGSSLGGAEEDQRGAAREDTTDTGSFEIDDIFLQLEEVVSMAEDDSGSTIMRFSVTLSRTSVETITVLYETEENTATNGSDFIPVSGSITFQPGDLVRTIDVVVNGDPTIEPDERFFLNIFDPANVAIATDIDTGLAFNRAEGNILNDDTSIEVVEVQQIELDSGMTQVNVDIRLEQPTVLQVTLDYATSNLTATDGVDYIGTSGSLTFAPGETHKTISFMIIGDTILEPNEEVFVNITNANDDLGNVVPSIDGQVGGGVITILNDEVSVSISDATAMEGMDLDFTVTLAHPVALPVTIDFATLDDTALGGSDYVSDSGTLTFTAGETTKTLSIASIADSSFETDETFTVQLSNPQRNLIPNGTISDSAGTGTILNDEPPPDVWRIVRNGANIDVFLNDSAFTSVDFAATTNLTIVGDTRNEFQQLTINGSPTGTFVLDLDGVLTNVIPIASSASFIQNELANLGNVGTGNVNVSDGATAGTFVIEFTGALAATDISTLAVDNTGLAGGTVSAISNIDGAVVTNDDLFIVDFSSGNPVPVNGLIVNGGNHIGGDGLEIRDSSGSTFGSVTYMPSGTNAGSVQLDGNTISFISLEQPVIDTTDADNRTLEFEAVFGNADHGLRLTNDFGINGNSLLRSTAGAGFVDVSFSNPNNSLTINAGPGNNSVTGDPVDSNFTATLNINGEAGDDNIDLSTLNAPAIISGGIGNDAIVGGMNNDLVMGDDGNDMVDGGSGNDTVGGGLGDDNVFGGDGNDTVSGGNGNDTLNGDAGDDVVDGQDGNDEVSGGSGNDTLTTTLGNDTLNGGSGNDMLQGSQNDDILNGDSGNDTLLAGLGNDVLDGGADNDSVFGEGGSDTVAGGGGNDSVDGGDGQDVLLVTSGNDTLNGGSDIDQVQSSVDSNQVLTDTQLAGIGVSDHLSVEQFLLTGGPSGNQIDARGYTLGSVTVQGMGGPDTIFGSQGDDSLEGGDGVDVIEGTDGDDVLVGNAGDDILDGKGGNDTIRGGGGDDFITGSSGDDSLLGQSGKDTLRGSTGNDVLRGDSENDSLAGGDGLDTLFGGNGADILDGQEGNDNLKGEDGDDSLMGSDGNDTLDGGAGDDTMRGGAQNDRMLGRDGEDLLDGGLGDDKGFGGSGSDVLVVGQGMDTLNGQGGLDDSVSITGDATQGDIFEVNNSTSRMLIRRTNLATFQAIVGETESLSFNLMGGDDSVIFQSLANTTLARVDIIAGAGNDTIDASAVLSITNFRVDGDDGDDTIQTGVGSDTINGGLGEDEIRTNNGNDVIRADEGNDFIAAGRGRDLIFGGVGNDKIFGGGGSDVIFGENGDDDIRSQGGHDTVDAGDGNDFVDASSGHDSVFGGKGFDTIAGGSGDDTLDGGVNNDILNGGSGNDRIIGGRGNDGLSGLGGNDTLIGNSGKDSMFGGDGNDFLYGGSGRDILSGGNGADLINGQGSDRDTVQGGSGGDGGAADSGDIFIAALATEINEEFSFFADWIDNV